ncbi:MAG TPA: 50S ribosomal protein L25/general stress protein Ctc [Stellaceae bacterium]|nr:50S ribosomal protein L25/general stress protein Ctc [Stellaceae bacterium]
MTEIVTLAAQMRDRAGKGAARATRRAGRIPAVIYGDKKEPVMVSLDPKTLKIELNKSGFFAKLVDLQIDGQTHRTLPRDVQLHPVSDEPLHVDFLRVSATTRITVEVPVHFDNADKSPGLKRGGMLNIVRHEIELHCEANSIPERINIDLTGYDIGDSVHISAVTLPAGATPVINERDFTIATIAAPTVAKADEAADAETAAAATPAA